jgi:hypothetical protein
MASVTPKAGAVLPVGDGSGFLAELSRLPSIIGGPAGSPPAGIAMKLDRDRDEFRIVVLDRDNAPLLSLGPYEEEEVVAEWRRLADRTGLTLKIQLANGSVMTPFPQIGRVQVGPLRMRRRHGLLNHRRPRFLTRRKAGRFPVHPQVHREAEMGEGNGR